LAPDFILYLTTGIELLTFIESHLLGFAKQTGISDLAVERMGETRLEWLPVVSRTHVHTLEGIETLADILESYGIGSRNSQSNSKRGAT
jgi:hypothetical protein